MLTFSRFCKSKTPKYIRNFSNSSNYDSHYNVIIAGGGITGSSIAYHLSKLGVNTLLLEQGKFTSGTTWHAASLVGEIRANLPLMKCCMYTTKLLKELKDLTGHDPGYRNCGAISLANNPHRLHFLQNYTLPTALNYGIRAKIIKPNEIKDLIPLMNVDDLIGGLHLPDDGSTTSSDLEQSYISGAKLFARKNGHKIDLIEDIRINGVKALNSGLNGFEITTNSDSFNRLTCDKFVNCTGQWGRLFGSKNNICIPLSSCEHYYIFSKALNPPVSTMMPVIRDPDAKHGYIYFREWSGGILSGSFESKVKAAFNDNSKFKYNNPPDNFEFGLFDDDWDHFEPLLEDILERFPILGETEIRMLNGGESFTPDNNPLLGEVSEYINYFVACGMNSAGIAMSGGVGKLLSHWIVNNKPNNDDINLFPKHLNIQRFDNRINTNRLYLINRSKLTLSGHSSLSLPYANPHNELRELRSNVLFEYQKNPLNCTFIQNRQNCFEIPAYFNVNNIKLDNTDNVFNVPNFQVLIDNELDNTLNNISIHCGINSFFQICGNYECIIDKLKDINDEIINVNNDIKYYTNDNGLIIECDACYHSIIESYIKKLIFSDSNLKNNTFIINVSNAYNVLELIGDKDKLNGFFKEHLYSESYDKIFDEKCNNKLITNNNELIDIGFNKCFISYEKIDNKLSNDTLNLSNINKYRLITFSDETLSIYKYLINNCNILPIGYYCYTILNRLFNNYSIVNENESYKLYNVKSFSQHSYYFKLNKNDLEYKCIGSDYLQNLNPNYLI